MTPHRRGFSPSVISRLAVAAIAGLLIFSVQPFSYAKDPQDESAGAEESRFQKERALEEIKKKPRLEKEEEEISPPTPAAADKGVRFKIRQVRVTGNQRVSTEELEPITSTIVGREVTLSEIEGVARKIKEYYRRKGYVASYVYIPPQRIESGVVEIRVVEGVLGILAIIGNRWFSEKAIRRRFRMKPGEVVEYDTLRADLSTLNKNPDIKAKAVLKPGAQSGTTDVEVQVKDEFPIHLSPTINNLGTRNTGRERYGATFVHNNLLGRMDQLSVRFQAGEGAWGVGTDYNTPVNRYGTRMGASYTRAEVDLKGDFEALGTEGDADVYSVYLLHPVVRKAGLEASGVLGFDWKSIENRQSGAVTGKDEFRILRPGVNFEQTDRFGKTFSPHNLNFGFDNIMGASEKVDSGATRAGTGGQFFVYRGSVIRFNRLPWDLMLLLQGHLQLTPDTLAPSEQLRLGGAFSVRGYEEAEYLADYGGHGGAEVWIPSYIFPTHWKLPFSDEPLYKRIQVIGFVDYGSGRIKTPLAGEEKSRAFAGAGGGLRFQLYDRLYARAEWGFPIGESEPNDGRSSAFYFGVSYDVLKGWFK